MDDSTKDLKTRPEIPRQSLSGYALLLWKTFFSLPTFPQWLNSMVKNSVGRRKTTTRA